MAHEICIASFRNHATSKNAKRRTNIRSQDWKTIGSHLDKRKDRESMVYLDGIRLTSEKVQRGVYRNFLTTFERLQRGEICLLLSLAKDLQ
jgi:hypothetical protein